MASDADRPAKPSDDPRRRRLLDAALGMFLRFGFRKTSMDDVARAADLSRQGLYLHFSTKEELFRAALEHALQTALEEASAHLKDASASLEDRLVGAFDAWVGRYIGIMGADFAELNEVSGALGGGLLSEYEGHFLEAVTRTVRSSGLPAAYRAAGLTARQLVDSLHAAARGLKYSSPTRDAFRESFAVPVKVLCFPLRQG